ncbi:protein MICRORCHIDIA 7 [Jatropha curcas]|uniref:protein MICRORCHIDIA 7 n=1 Tax=Jatropha curcas TaxID=180498 RepID=UPI0009D796DC|nr:protein MICRORCHIDIA 7 [Jatropha curcas]
MDSIVKRENPEPANSSPRLNQKLLKLSQTQISYHSGSSSSSSSSSDSDSNDIDDGGVSNLNANKRKQNSSFGDLLKKPKREEEFCSIMPPAGFLASLNNNQELQPQPLLKKTMERKDNSLLPLTVAHNNNNKLAVATISRGCKQFWKAGDYEEDVATDSTYSAIGMDHVRVHPKFLHSNATSHKWALGAFAELLDNALDEVCNGATYVNVDVLENQKDGSMMILVEDNGGGMNPDKMRQCMSLGYSAKSKMSNAIGQYGNGFKTSTMRLGADVIVFSRCDDGKSPTQSIGLLSYTFLRATGKEDIVVPMIDFEKKGKSNKWNKKIRSSLNDWNANSEIILQWSPFISEEDLFKQFEFLEDQGTRIIIYNLWEDDEGNLELDFDTNPHDIQIRGVNRDERNIQMAKQYPSARHFLTYQHSLRSYAAILYLRLPTGFRIFLRGKDVEHHDIVNDMILAKNIVYRPQHVENDPDVAAYGTIGFVKDAHHHIDVQGFNVYHKNRLIKPFWRVWNAAGSDGRGVIGLMEVNFVEPAHDKQGFERTNGLSRLEARLNAIQKSYWSSNCQEIGYAARRHPKNHNSSNIECTSQSKNKVKGSAKGFPAVHAISPNQQSSINGDLKAKACLKLGETPLRSITTDPLYCSVVKGQQMATGSHSKAANTNDMKSSNNLKKKGPELKDRFNGQTGKMVDNLIKSLEYEREKQRKLENQACVDNLLINRKTCPVAPFFSCNLLNSFYQ